MIKDDWRSGSVSMRHQNFSKLLDRSMWCRMKYNTSSFGVSLHSPIGLNYKQGMSLFLRKFITLTLVLDFAIQCLMKAFVGSEAISDVFREVLFYNFLLRQQYYTIKTSIWIATWIQRGRGSGGGNLS